MTESTEAASPCCVHLHVHSEYSLTDGAIRIDDLITKVAAMGHKAVALTDHANLFAAIEFYSKAKYQNIKPIIGAELYVEPLAETVEFANTMPHQPWYRGSLGPSFQGVFLAKNVAGYHRLVKLVSAGYRNNSGSEGLPRVTIADLKEHLNDELIFISSFHGGEFAFLATQMFALQKASGSDSQVKEAIAKFVETYQNLLGKTQVYTELCANNFPDDPQKLDAVASAAAELQIPLVASANAHYLNKDDQEAHTVLVAIKNELKLTHLRERRKNVRAHLFTDEEMREYYAAWPSSLSNTLAIAEMCNVQFEFGKYFLPKINLSENETTADALARLAQQGLEQRLQSLRKLYGASLDAAKENVYKERLAYEIKVISDMGFPDYFLIVQDFINWAKEQDIPVGPGRGSGAGSLVAYALRITDLDPLPYNLIFERFLNPERVSMPDFDVDFCQDRRDEVIKYVTERYGNDQVAQITTFGKMLAKAALRDVGRVFDVSYNKIDRLAKLIPNELGIKLKDAIEREPRLREEAAKDPLLGDVMRFALQLEGLSRHTSVHAAGIVISDGPMENYVPVYRSPDGSLITQYEMKNAEKVGLVKFDFLGLKTLTVIKGAVDILKTTRNLHLDISQIPLDDRKVYQLISEARSVGVFQLEGGGMQQLLLKLKPSTFEDIIALVALFRPGPLQSGMVDDFVERKHGRQKIEYTHPALEPILKDTYGTILYQEQVQKIAAVLASYTLGEADLLRRAMGKKKPEEMAKQKSRFVSGCQANQIDEQVAANLFDLMAKFAEYGFNKSHSAAYGLVSYQTAFLKANYPAEFFAASMTCDMDNTDKIVRYARDCKAFGLNLLAPDINRSELDFTVPDPQSVRYGLAAIKGIGRAVLEPLVKERHAQGPFLNLTQLAKRVNLNKLGKKSLELLTQAGALDCFGISRAVISTKIEELVKYSQNHHEASDRGQRGLFAEMESDRDESDQFGELSALQIIDPALSTGDPAYWLKKEKLLLGLYLSKHPLAFFAHERQRFTNAKLKELPKLAGQSSIYVLAILYDAFERTTKDDRKLLVLRLEDDDVDFTAQVPANEFPGIEHLPEFEGVVVAKFKVLKGFEDKPPRPRLEGLMSIDDFRRQRLKAVSLTFKPKSEQNADSSLAQRLLEVCKKYPGRTPLQLSISLPRTKVELTNHTLSVDPTTSLLCALRQCATGNTPIDIAQKG